VRKKVLATLFAVCLLFILLPMKTLASDVIANGVCGPNTTWTLSSDGILTISGKGGMYSYDDDAPWNAYLSDINSVKIESGVTEIGFGAFMGCINLKNVAISDGVQEVRSYAFSGCSSLERIDLPNSMRNIRSYSFEQCANLNSVTIPDSVEKIGSHAFLDCVNLTSIKLPDNTALEESAFRGCSGLESVNIPSNTTTIPEALFYECSSLKSIEIPGKVTEIGGNAFMNCSSLKSIEIPDSVRSIGDVLFSGCTNLEYVIIPEGITEINYFMFSDCSNLKSVAIPDSVTSIGNFAFYKCTNLTDLVIPENVQSIGEWAFTECKLLKSIEIPDGVTEIGANTFSHCHQLNSVTIPDSVVSIGESAFYGCLSLLDVYYIGSKEQWELISIGGRNTEITNAAWHHMHKKVIDPAVESTYFKTGLTEGSHCSVCGEVIEKQQVAPIKTLGTPKLNAKATSTDKIKLTWGQVPGATSYEIVRSNRQAGNYEKIQTISGGSTVAFTDTRLNIQTTYYYKIRAIVSAGGNSMYGNHSAIAIATTSAPAIQVTAGSGGKVSGGGTKKVGVQVTLKATPNTGYYFTGWKENGKKISSSQTYTFKVTKSRTLTAGFAKVTKPTLTAASANVTSVKLSWKKIAGATGYEIYRASSKNGKYTKIATISESTTLKYTDKRLTTGKMYYYKVRAVASGKVKTTYSSYSGLRNVKPVPLAPTGIKAVAGLKRVKLSWKKVSGTTGYEIYRATSKSGKYKKVKMIAKISTISYIDKKLTAKKNYYYKVRAYKTVNGKKVYGAFSDIKGAKTKG
jgi:fibronectin type 3 domain-containing protein